MRFPVLLCLLLSTLLSAAERLPPLGSDVYAPVDLPRTGLVYDVLKDADGKEIIRYGLLAPERLPERRTLMLCVIFHGRGNKEDIVKWLRIEHPDLDPTSLMVLALKSQQSGWSDADLEPALKAVAWAIDTYPVDRRRLVVIGYSSGAIFQRSFAGPRQDEYAGICTIGLGFSVPPVGKDSANLGSDCYLLVGENDQYKARVFAMAAGLDVSKHRYDFHLIAGASHTSIFSRNTPPNLAALQEMALWASGQRHKTRGLYTEDSAFLKEQQKRGVDALWGDAKGLAELARIGGAEAGALVEQALKAKSAVVRRSAATMCGRTVYGEAVTRALGRVLLGDDDPAVAAAAATSLGVLADWGHASAMEALTTCVQTRKIPAATRCAAINGLGRRVAFEAAGSRRADLDMYATLVKALADPEASVREAALTVLRLVGGGDDRGYVVATEPGKQPAALTAWQAWAMALTKPAIPASK